MSRLKAVALVLSGALASMLYCGWLIVGHIESDAGALAEAREEGYAAAEEDRLAIVVDRPIAEGNSMPLWLQTDPQWDYIPYAGGTIGEYGCGLTCAAMAVKYMTLQDITPLTLASFVGDTCLTDGVNDPGKFCAWIAEHYPEYGIESTPISYDLAPVLQNVSDGWLAFAGMSGTLGDRDYGGHVVMIWRADDDGYWIRDPASAGNSARAFTLEELEQVDFHYFYCIRGASMALNGIDISNYQRGLDLAQVPCDFVICKATEGTTIVHNTCDPWIQQAIKLGKLWGFYHFMNGEDPIAQAKHFVASCRNYFGNGIPVLDYEMYGRIGTDKAKLFLDYVYDQTGVRCIVYMSRSVCTEEDWSQIAPNHALWVAQYANNNRTGYQSSPWLPDGGFGAWDSCAIHQYTSNGRLDGFNAPLDLDIAYMTREAWGKFANPSGAAAPDVPPAEVAEPSPEGTTLDLAAAVMRGEYGVDAERREKLGDRYQEVQDLINYIDGASASQLADDVERGMFGVVPTRSDVLGDRFSEVQAIVNQRAGVGAARVYTVKSGDTLSEIGASLGIDWHTIASKNGIGAPYTIYPGQKLSY